MTENIIPEDTDARKIIFVAKEIIALIHRQKMTTYESEMLFNLLPKPGLPMKTEDVQSRLDETLKAIEKRENYSNERRVLFLS